LCLPNFCPFKGGEKDTLRVRKEIVEDYIRHMGSWSKNNGFGHGIEGMIFRFGVEFESLVL
jgi:hypothetical protein